MQILYLDKAWHILSDPCWWLEYSHKVVTSVEWWHVYSKVCPAKQAKNRCQKITASPSNSLLRTNVASSGQLLSHLWSLRVCTSRIAPTTYFSGLVARDANRRSYLIVLHVKTANKHAAHTWHWDPFGALDSVEGVWHKYALHIAKMLMILSFLELELAYMEGGHAGLHECRL